MNIIIDKGTQQERKLNYIDYGSGKPIIFIHGWPLSHKSWEPQVSAFVEEGFRVIAYDRKGFGQSCATWNGYDYSSLAADLHTLITELKLTDVSLVGFSMGGGEVVRYLTDYGSENISKVALVASIIPLVKQMPDNPHGVPQENLDEILKSLKEDRVKFLETFLKNFYNVGILDKPVSQQKLHFDWNIASSASAVATYKAAQAWMDTDFREEAKRIDVPTLIIHGDDDKAVPIATAGEQAQDLIPNSTLLVYEKAPHGLNVTHAERLNVDLLAFFKS